MNLEDKNFFKFRENYRNYKDYSEIWSIKEIEYDMITLEPLNTPVSRYHIKNLTIPISTLLKFGRFLTRLEERILEMDGLLDE